MAVYTAVEADQLQSWLNHFGFSQLLSYKGISQGIENTNYFVEAVRDNKPFELVFTIFERLTEAQLRYYLALMRDLALQSFPAPLPYESLDGQPFLSYAGKPATILSKLVGQPVTQSTVEQCFEIGKAMARMHQISSGWELEGQHDNPRGYAWRCATANQIENYLAPSQRQLLAQVLSAQELLYASESVHSLPVAHCHCDLFMDNALFIGNELGGVIDFYFAGWDHCVFDIAVTANDWCICRDFPLDHPSYGTLDDVKLKALISGYESVRLLTVEERHLLPHFLMIAALRFWLSRLEDWFKPRNAELLTPHNPVHFENVLRNRLVSIVS